MLKLMLQTERHHFVAPTLWAYHDSLEAAARRGTVLFYHGLGSSKDGQNKDLFSLAERGFLAIGVDNVGHGERCYPDFERRFAADNPDWEQELLLAVSQTAQEVPALLDAFLERGLIDPEKLGLVGISMGGYIAYAALLQEPRLKAVSVVLGSPHWALSDFDSPDRHPEHFFPTALLSQNAGQDASVSPHEAREFHQHLTPFYAPAPERLAYFEYPDSGHFMREDDWMLCWERNLSWFERFL